MTLTRKVTGHLRLPPLIDQSVVTSYRFRKTDVGTSIRVETHLGRSYDVCWTPKLPELYRDVFNVESTSTAQIDG